MSGFVERIVEDWLTSAKERSYQLAFVGALRRAGHTIKYVSPQLAPLEHGKDIVSLYRGELRTFQLKAGDIGTSEWRSIAEEVREGATVPIDIPGLRRRVADRSHLVLTGHVSDPVRNKINLINDDHQQKGHATIETIEIDQLVGDFTRAFESFCPADITALHRLVQLYLQDGRGPQDCPQLANILDEITKSRSSVPRRLSNLLIAAQFAAHPFAKLDSYIGVIDTWVVAATRVMKLVCRLNLQPKQFLNTLDLCFFAIDSAADSLIAEAFSRGDFMEGDPLLDSAFVKTRSTIVLGYVAAALNSKRIAGVDTRADGNEFLRVLGRELPLAPWGEGAWNYYLNVILALKQNVNGDHLAAGMAASWLDFACPAGKKWPKDPYWTASSQFSPAKLREEQDNPIERTKMSYTASSALSLVVRRMWRTLVAPKWAALSRYQMARLTPDEPCDELDWQVEAGRVELETLPDQGSWRVLRKRAFEERHPLFRDTWSRLLPLFLCTFPHRTSNLLSGELDWLTSSHAGRADWH